MIVEMVLGMLLRRMTFMALTKAGNISATVGYLTGTPEGNPYREPS